MGNIQPQSEDQKILCHLPQDLKRDIEKIIIVPRPTTRRALKLKETPFFVREILMKQIRRVTTPRVHQPPSSPPLPEWVKKWYVLSYKGGLTESAKSEYVNCQKFREVYGKGYIPPAPPVPVFSPAPVPQYPHSELQDWVVHQYILSQKRKKKFLS